MCRNLIPSACCLAGILVAAGAARADVVLRGPFGRQIVIPTPVDVQVGPGVYVGPGPTRPVPPPAKVVNGPDVVSTPMPLVRLQAGDEVLPQPRSLTPGPAVLPPAAVAPIPLRDFARTFQPAPGNYEVLFVHPGNHKPVAVAFSLPPGQPRVSCGPRALTFDYGRCEVEIRFKIGGKVVVTTTTR
jgi:hypothetical protein